MHVRLADAQALVDAIKANDETAVNQALSALSLTQHAELVQRVEQLSQDFQAALQHIHLDGQLADYAEGAMRDAHDNLAYVVEQVEQGVNKTLDISESLVSQMKSLEQKLSSSGVTAEDLQSLSQMHHQLNEVILAQSFQDLTGQVLRKVIGLMKNIEAGLIDLLAYARSQGVKVERHQPEVNKSQGSGPAVTQNEKQGSMSNQKDVDNLLDELGI